MASSLTMRSEAPSWMVISGAFIRCSLFGSRWDNRVWQVDIAAHALNAKFCRRSCNGFDFGIISDTLLWRLFA